MERFKELLAEKLTDTSDCCIFCFRHKSRIELAKTVGNIDFLKQEYLIATGAVCSYGYHHEFVVKEKPKQIHKQSGDICLKCCVHRKNPLSTTNGCSHTYL